MSTTYAALVLGAALWAVAMLAALWIVAMLAVMALLVAHGKREKAAEAMLE